MGEKNATLYPKRMDWKFDALLENLGTAGVDYVLVTKLGGDTWPAQEQRLAGSPGAQSVYDDGQSVIWKILRPRP